MGEEPMSKNWTSNFVHRHESRLLSKYLRNIDNQRAHAEYAPLFSHLYDLVPLLPSVDPKFPILMLVLLYHTGNKGLISGVSSTSKQSRLITLPTPVSIIWTKKDSSKALPTLLRE
jgi:hypothetical protein